MFFHKKRYYLLTAAFQMGYEAVNGITLFKRKGKASLFDVLNHSATMLKVDIGKIMPLFFHEIDKKAFTILNDSFKKIDKETDELERREKMSGHYSREIN